MSPFVTVIHVINLTLLAAAVLYLNRRRLGDRRFWVAAGTRARSLAVKAAWAAFTCAACLEVATHPIAFPWFPF